MTVNATSPRADYAGNDVATVIPFDFSAASAADLAVYLRDADGTISKLSSGFTVNLNGDGVGGTVVFSTAPTSEQRGVVLRETPRLQDTSIPSAGPFTAKVVEITFDDVVRQVQELSERLNRALSFGPVDNLSGALGDAASYAGRTLVFNSSTLLPEPGALAVDIENISGISAEITAISQNIDTIQTIGDDLALGLSSLIRTIADDLQLGSDSAIRLAQTSATSAASSAAVAQQASIDASGYAVTALNHANTASGHQDAAQTAAGQAAASADQAALSATGAEQAATNAIAGIQAQIDELNYVPPTVSVDITTPGNETQEIGTTINDVTIAVSGSYNTNHEPITVEVRQKSGSWVDVTSQMTIGGGSVSGSVDYTALGLTSASSANSRTFEARITDNAVGLSGGNPVESNEDSIDFRPRLFWSSGTESAPANSAAVRALPNSSLVNSLNLLLSPPPGSGTRTIYFVFPKSYVTGGAITAISNGATSTTFETSDSQFTSISVNDAGGTATDNWLFALIVDDTVSSLRIAN